IAEANAIMQFNSGTFTYNSQTHLTGAGTYQLTGGLFQGLDTYLPNLLLLGGSVQLSPSYQGNGLIHQLDLSGSTLLGSNRVSGTLNLYSGAVAGQVSISANAVLNWWSGQFGPGSTLRIDTNGLANLATSNEKTLGGQLLNAGQLEWLAGTVTVRND